MQPADSQTDRPGAVRRRTVRIVKSRTTSRASTVSLALAIGAAFFMLALWWMWRDDDVVFPPQRTLTAVEMTWKCPVGHVFRAAGQIESRACWTRNCDRPAYPVAQYACPEHGAYEAAVRFRRGENGAASVAELRLIGRDWVAADKVACPRCGKGLIYASRDPLESVRRR